MSRLARALALATMLPALVTVVAHAAPLSESTAHGESPVRIVPYEISYDVSLKSAEERSGMLMASGVLFSRMEGSPCEGWSSTSRMKVRFVFRREAVRETESRVASWESDDGNRFYSRIERYLNGLPVETVRVKASRDRAGRPFRLEMTEPERRATELPPQTLFPTTALKKLLAAARQGRRELTMLLYEGDEEAAPQHVVALIGRRHAPLMPASEAGEKAGPHERKVREREEGDLPQLRQRPYWPVSLAYYGPVVRKDGSRASDREREAERFGLPEYEVHFRLYDNGVTGDALLIYPDYVLRAKATKLRLLQPAACK